MDQREWYVGATLASTKPIPFVGARGGRALMSVVRHTDRNLPVIAVSRHEGAMLTPTFDEELARDLSGVALIASVDEAAGWEISSEYGREWSCYNGALRLYWPLRPKSVSAYDHPLWTRERMLERAADEADAANRMRHQLRRQLLALSTYTVGEPTALMRIFADAANARLAGLRESASSVDDWVAIAEEYARENLSLKVRGRELEEQQALLQAQVDSLNIALQYQEVGEEILIRPESAPPVATVSDAVEAARMRLAEDLEFGRDVSEGIGGLAVDAGPPDKIYEYLRVLAEMTSQRRAGGLGRDLLIWLREQGVKGSNESDTVLNSSAEMQKRTWDNGKGGRQRFSKHLKPSEGTSPDRCVRIYFEYDEALGKTIVGWIGRHP